MKILENLYSQPYFAPVLFGIIVVLAILFIVILILALRDLKKNSKNKVDNTQDLLSKTDDESVNLEMMANQDNNIDNSNVNNNFDMDATIEFKTPVNGFQPINVEAPTMEDNVVENAVVDNFNVEEKVNVTEEEVSKAENDLDTIAATLLAEYKKENVEDGVTEVSETSSPKDQFSSVYVKPDTLPVEEKKRTNIPNFADIPMPQGVRVVNSSNIIDSSVSNKQEDNNEDDNYQKLEHTADISVITNEEYHL